jgi:hypothetical protein
MTPSDTYCYATPIEIIKHESDFVYRARCMVFIGNLAAYAMKYFELPFPGKVFTEALENRLQVECIRVMARELAKENS